MEFIKKHKLFTIIVIISMFFIFLIGASYEKEKVTFVEDGVAIALNPLQNVVYKFNYKVKDNFKFLFDYKEVKKENEELLKANKEFKRYELQNKLLEKENKRLREMLNFVKSSTEEYEYIGCDIIGISGNSFFDGFEINKGTKEGIKKRMVAITADGLVGQVTSVGTNWSIVQTLANENIAVAGYIERTSVNNGIVKGDKRDDNELFCKIEIPTLEADIKEGDVVLTSGIGKIYPKGIEIGKVIQIIEDKGKVSKYGLIEPYVDINKLEEVFIVIPKEIREVEY